MKTLLWLFSIDAIPSFHRQVTGHLRPPPPWQRFGPTVRARGRGSQAGHGHVDRDAGEDESHGRGSCGGIKDDYWAVYHLLLLGMIIPLLSHYYWVYHIIMVYYYPIYILRGLPHCPIIIGDDYDRLL